MTVETLRIGRTLDRCRVLGPGTRAVLWVTGCRLRCKECMTPEFLDFQAGEDAPIGELATWLRALDAIDGVTFSGGEPFEQAGGLAALVDAVRPARPQLTFMAFTGYTVERLQRGTSDQQALLERLDIVVDGPYLPERHHDGRWRGSSNQRVHDLSGRAELDALDESAGIEFVVEPDGGFAIAGVPPTRGFRPQLERRLLEHEITVTTKETA